MRCLVMSHRALDCFSVLFIKHGISFVVYCLEASSSAAALVKQDPALAHHALDARLLRALLRLVQR